MSEFSFVEIEAVGVGIALRWLTVDHEDTWDLRQLSEYYFVFVFNSPDDAILEQVPIPFIFFVSC